MLDAYAALEAADYDALPDLIARLDAAIEENPDVGRLSFYAGTMRLWRAIGAPRTVNEVLEDVQGAIDAFERAHDLSPQDPHAAAFLGITQVAFGNALRDEQRIETGRAVLADNTHLYPPYVNGVRTQAMGMLPRDHAYFPEAIDAMYATLAACGAETAPDADFSIVYPSAASDPLPTCWNQGVVDHVWEGIFLIYGDVFVKNGEPARARQLYEAARLSPTFETWLFGDELDERIASSDDRAALYLDADPANDPLTWMQGQNLCVGCHASRP
jgi:tetratricopeptide (TPR) repeat protein